MASVQAAPTGQPGAMAQLPPNLTPQMVKDYFVKWQQMKAQGAGEDNAEYVKLHNILKAVQQQSEAQKQRQQHRQQQMQQQQQHNGASMQANGVNGESICCVVETPTLNGTDSGCCPQSSRSTPYICHTDTEADHSTWSPRTKYAEAGLTQCRVIHHIQQCHHQAFHWVNRQ
jgi:hypothetical protein